MRLAATIQGDNCSATLMRADALEFLESLPSASVDLFVTSPPYFVGKEYDRSRSLVDFRREILRVAPEVTRVVRPGGSVCWQIGNHVENGRITPLDAVLIGLYADQSELILRNRIIWTFGHGTHAVSRFSGRHESILWYTKGNDYRFDLDAVRVTQKYPGKKHYKGPKKGQWSGNPLGKNPGDVWDIPNVKARHVEKTGHPCQFPIALVRRLILSLCPLEGVVVDPYMGSGTTAIASLMLSRNFFGCDLEKRYVRVASARAREFLSGRAKIREDMPVRLPKAGESVTFLPDHFKKAITGPKE